MQDQSKAFPTVTFTLSKEDFPTINDLSSEHILDMFAPAVIVLSEAVHGKLQIDPIAQKVFVFTAVCPIYKNVEHSTRFNTF